MPSPEQRADQRVRIHPSEPIPVAPLAAILIDHAQQGDLLFAASDEQRAAAVAAIAAALAPDLLVVHLPSSDALPGDDAPASPGNIGRRVAALRLLRQLPGAPPNGPRGPNVLLVTTAEATAVAYADPQAFHTAPPAIAVGDPIDLAAFAEQATEIGYVADDRVDEPGEVAILGSVIDIFPADHDGPVRIVVTDGVVGAISAYDPVSQLTVEAIDRIEIGRASEPAETAGVSILAHLPGAALAYDVGAEDRRARFLAIAAEAGRLRRGRQAVRIIDDADWHAARAEHREVTLADTAAPPPRFAERRDPARAFARFAKTLLEDGRLLVAGSPRDLRFLAARLQRVAGITLEPVASFAEAQAAKPGSAMMLAAPIDRGFVADGLTVVAGGDLLGGRAGGEDRTSAGSDALFGEFSELRIGDVIVHEDFGIGVVAGLEALADGDAIALDYAKGGRRLVAVTEADRIWRYGADADAVTLDALDGSSWQRRRGAIDAAIAHSARELAAIAAARDGRQTDPIAPDASVYERFASGFAFTETPDQARAIAAVRDDLASGTPMDRLVVGDVGYGKTEVALRAAALVALAGRQVVIAAPTTVLVRQHLELFTRRFEATGVAVAGLSRLSSPAEKKRVMAGLADGSIGIVVGTGAVAGKGVAYADLALVVVDEEQRFGAADKAKLHALGAGHVLTLSATPIPRTLQSAMVGLQTISVIATPPARRQPIRTVVTAFDDVTIRTALLRERGRGGQSFVVVPRIDDMAPLADTLARLVPELHIVTAHGKMPASALDEAMVAFANGRGDVLLATNIIEAGLDVPRANTMIVHHADRFGLSQLHQLRGRVGRSGRRGQVLLTTDAGATIAEATLKRLRTLQAFDRLGAGFAISARDLDLRGAGDLVGEAQAGHMKLIGTDLYQHLMAHALRAARGQAEDLSTPELNLELSGCLPPAWIPDTGVRLSLYARLARLSDGAALDAFEAELEDRFGAVPAAARDLLDVARIRALARSIDIRRIDAGQAAIAFTPRRQDQPVPAGLVAKNGRWLLTEAIADAADRVQRVREVLEEIE
ncbi:helicase-related protein [Sphingomonas sp. PB2P19]|uniref:helicase-related protein n=1 Tax=Sphingomonas rhamnosi TaxID=3096156 RepID=UPI003FA681DB